MDKHIGKIKHKTFYKLNESVRFKELEEASFDLIPDDILEAEEDNQEISNEPSPEGDEAPNPPEFNQNVENEPIVPNQEEPVEPEETVDEIQNDIIKLNTVALNRLNTKLDDIEKLTSTLNDKINKLSFNVEEVREPDTNEKFMAKKNVSFPYYANLNDYWNNSWFSKENDDQINGIKQLPDGSYIADFDDLPKTNNIELRNSFNDYI